METVMISMISRLREDLHELLLKYEDWICEIPMNSSYGVPLYNQTWFIIKMSSYRYRKSHSCDKRILRPSYLHHGISYTGKMASLYWIRAQLPMVCPLSQAIVPSGAPCSSITMMTSSNRNISALLTICAGNSPVPGEFPAQRPVTRSFDVFFDLRLNKPLSKQSWGWWFETPSRPLLHHCNALDLCISSSFLPPSVPSFKRAISTSWPMAQNMKVIKNLLIVMVLFNVCWTPFLILCIAMSYNPDYYEPRMAHWYNYFLLLFSLNSGMNPIVYAARFRPFQVAFKLMFGCIKNEYRAKAISDASDWGGTITTWFTEQSPKAITGQN